MSEILRFEENLSLIVLGARRTGKSVIIEKIIRKYETQFDSTIIFTNSVGLEKYKKITKSKLVFQRYSENVLKKAVEYQSQNLTEKCLVIFDDCISTKNKNDETINKLF